MVASTTAPAVPVANKAIPAALPPIRFKNADVEFTSLLISTDMIRVNISIRNTTQQPIYLWNGSEQNKSCGSVSLTDDLGNDFVCSGETLYAFGPYSKGDGGKVIETGSSMAFQYVFDRISKAPGKEFSFSTSPFLTVAKPPQDVKSGAFFVNELYNVESLGITFSDVVAKVRPASK